MTHVHSVEDLRDALAPQLRGRCLTAGMEGYESARTLWNAQIDRRPALISQPTGTADVQRSIAFARSNGLEISIRGGGHNAAGLAATEGGLMVDLGAMRQVRVDPAARRAWCQGGANWGDYDRETHVFGMAQTGGAVSTTGVAGLTLGGGLGLLMRKQGLTIDNLHAAELVTADSRVVRASADENEDLFWALRGGGGNFGVVTGFEFDLHDVSHVLDGFTYHPMDDAAELAASARDLADTMPDEAFVVLTFASDPAGKPMLALRGSYAGDRSTGEKIVSPLRALGNPVDDDTTWRPYPEAQSVIDELFAPGMQVYWRAHFIRTLSDEVIGLLTERCREPSSAFNFVVVEQLGGAVARVPTDATVFEYRDAGWQIAIGARWQDPGDPRADEHVEWVRSLHEELLPHAYGVYVNYLGVGESADRVRVAYPPAKWDRLVAVKDKYDPDNLFRRNQNIPPSGWAPDGRGDDGRGIEER